MKNVGVEDIVQECMIGLWDSSLQFPNVRSLAGWLYKAVYNRALNMIRDRDNARRVIGKLYFRGFTELRTSLDLRNSILPGNNPDSPVSYCCKFPLIFSLPVSSAVDEGS